MESRYASGSALAPATKLDHERIEGRLDSDFPRELTTCLGVIRRQQILGDAENRVSRSVPRPLVT
jgi:hypothetical protein